MLLTTFITLQMQASPSMATLTLMLVTILMSPWHLAAECQHGLYYFRVLFSSFSVIQILVIACPATSPHEKKTVTVIAARCLIVVILLPVSSANSLYGFGKCYGLPMKYNQLESLMDTRSVSIPPGLLLLPQGLSPFLSFPLLSAGHLLLHALGGVLLANLHDLGFMPGCYIMYVRRVLSSQQTFLSKFIFLPL